METGSRIYLGYVGASRKRKRLCLYGRTRAEAAERLTASLRKKQVGVQIRFEKQSVGEFLQRWLDDVRSTIRPRTFERFEGLVRLHILPALGKHRLDRLTPQHIQQLLTAKSNENLSPQSVKHVRTVLSVALGRALKWNMVSINAAQLTDAPKVERKPVKTFDQDDAKKFLATVRGTRLEAFYTVALVLGLRRGEVLGLAWEDVDFEAGKLQVNQSLQRAGQKPAGWHHPRPRAVGARSQCPKVCCGLSGTIARGSSSSVWPPASAGRAAV